MAKLLPGAFRFPKKSGLAAWSLHGWTPQIQVMGDVPIGAMADMNAVEATGFHDFLTKGHGIFSEGSLGAGVSKGKLNG